LPRSVCLESAIKQRIKKKLKEMIPTYDIKLKEISNLTDVEQYKLWSERAEESLGLKDK
jgi:hypothetical protein